MHKKQQKVAQLSLA